MCVNMGVRKFGPFKCQKSENLGFIYFLLKKGFYQKPGGAEKGGYSACTSVLCHLSHDIIDFQQCGILTSVYSDEPVQTPFKLRNSK